MPANVTDNLQKVDVLVVGGGHAGTEAAWAASRLGATTALVTMSSEAIGRMSCNPAIGGLGKGQMVREIDALGGLMGLATDRGGIQFRMLNRSKGPAVWAPRAQCDRALYAAAVQDLLGQADLQVIEGCVEHLMVEETADNVAPRRVRGVVLADGRQISAGAVILTTGTFLRGLMHCGQEQTAGGRVGEHAANGLSRALLDAGFELHRLKTGTPPRVHRDSVDFDRCEIQPGDDCPEPFSFMTDHLPQQQLSCWITWTHEDVHRHIRDNLHLAPMYSGQIESTGPRYCPSIEDKVVRFADKPRHQVFLEPEGYDNERIYCNGISTSLPADVQATFIRRIPALEKAEIIQPGYAVEYDCAPTHQLRPSMESKPVAGLYLAGQINGTSGYEEAAGQGLIAGINAARALDGQEPLALGRDEAYIGVMIDDLITSPPLEPYRMFTSRAEYRLLLRADNADQRLTPIGRNLGLVDDARWDRFEDKRRAMASLKDLCDRTTHDGGRVTDWMRRPEADLHALATILPTNGRGPFGADVLRQVLVDAKYAGYIDRQDRQIERFRRLESMRIPPGLDYHAMRELRMEAREKLTRVGPATLGQAGRISGISPADVTVVWIYLTRKRGLNGSA